MCESKKKGGAKMDVKIRWLMLPTKPFERKKKKKNTDIREKSE